jgi:hypothetical protein
MTPDLKAFVRDAAILLGIPLLATIGLVVWWAPWELAGYRVPPPRDVFSVAAGTWDWAGADSFCVADPHRIWFSPDHSIMYLADRRPWKDSAGTEHRVTEYAIQMHTPSTIRGAIRGETRLTDSGVPVVWDLVLTSEGSYRWHRTDWPRTGMTKQVLRCPVSLDSLLPGINGPPHD